MAFCWNSQKFAGIRRMFAEHPPNIRRIPVRHNSHSPKFAEIRRMVVPAAALRRGASPGFAEIRRNSQKFAGFGRGPERFAEYPPNIRRTSAEYSPNVADDRRDCAEIRRNSPKFAEIRRICSFLTLRRLQIRRNSPNIRRNSPNVRWPERLDRPDSQKFGETPQKSLDCRE